MPTDVLPNAMIAELYWHMKRVHHRLTAHHLHGGDLMGGSIGLDEIVRFGQDVLGINENRMS
jgi:hypothetical protein